MWTRDSITWLNVSFIVNFHATEQRSYVSKLILLFIELVCDHVTKATDHNLISASIQYNCGHVTRNTIWRNLSPSLFTSKVTKIVIVCSCELCYISANIFTIVLWSRGHTEVLYRRILIVLSCKTVHQKRKRLSEISNM